MSITAIVLLAAAAVLLVMTERSRWASSLPRSRRGNTASRVRSRRLDRNRPKLEIVRPESEDFVRSVERDLAALPTIDEHDVKRR